MEIKINKEIREYNERMIMGLTKRQTVFLILICIVSVSAFFILRDILPVDIVGWICVLVSAPFGIAGFFRYNGMSAFEYLSRVIGFYSSARILKRKENNLWMEMMKG